jgi:long-chain-fatty-acid--CoA ligase ACSBG
MTAAAPIMRDTLDFFMSLDMPILELYGMSETSGPHTISFPWMYRTQSVGEELFGATTKFSNPAADGNGEVLMNGRNIFMGYLGMEERTLETLDAQGWVRSGDVGRRDSDGFIFITGRIKELLITAGGENVSPILIEDSVKEQLPCVSNAMLVGDARKYLCVLLTLKTVLDPDTTESTGLLTRDASAWFREHAGGVDVTAVKQVVEGRENRVLEAIQKGIERVNRCATSRAQFIQKWTVLPGDFSIPGGELGPTLKLKRNVVLQKYSETIESLYAESEPSGA